MRSAKEVGKFLRNLMKEHGETPTDIAKLLDTTVEKINGVLNGEVFINPFENVEKLCDHYGITVGELLDV